MPEALLRIICHRVGADHRLGVEVWRPTLQGGPVLVAATRSPLVDGALALLALGHPLDAPVTLRLAGKHVDGFAPVPLAIAARLTRPRLPGARHTTAGGSAATPVARDANTPPVTLPTALRTRRVR